MLNPEAETLDQICYAVPLGSSFVATGISLTIQGFVTGLVVHLTPKPRIPQPTARQDFLLKPPPYLLNSGSQLLNAEQVNTVKPSYGRRGALPQTRGNDVSVEAEPSVRLTPSLSAFNTSPPRNRCTFL